MLIDRPSIKQASRILMRETRPSVYPVTLLYLVIVTVIQTIISVLSGVTTFYQNVFTYANMNAVLTYEDLLNLIPRPGLVSEILIVALALTLAIVSAGYQFYCLKVSRRIPGSYRDVVSGFNSLGKVAAIAVIQAVFIFLWSMLFVIPGIIAAYRYRMSYYILYDHPDMRAIDCIRASKRMMQGNKWTLFTLHLSFLGWMILSCIISIFLEALVRFSFPILEIYITPYMGITEANFYNALLLYEQQRTSGTPSGPGVF